MDVKLDRTCYACPEQYDAYYGEEKIGYLRLRHGYFSVEYKEPFEELVYSACPKGDGIFDDDERDHYLNIAKQKLLERHLQNPYQNSLDHLKGEHLHGHSQPFISETLYDGQIAIIYEAIKMAYEKGLEDGSNKNK